MQVYYINLDSRADRRAFMEAQFVRLGLNAQRVVAKRLDEITAADRVAGYPWLDDGGIICGLSHIKALSQFLETQKPWALILEDDAALSASLPAMLRLADEGTLAADLIRIEASGNIVTGPPQGIGLGFALCRNFSWFAGSAAYLVSRHAAEVLVRGRWLRNEYADVALFDPYKSLARILDVRQLVPALAAQQKQIDRGSSIWVSDLQHDTAPTPYLVQLARKVGTSINRDVYGVALKAWQRRFGGASIRNIAFKPD